MKYNKINIENVTNTLLEKKLRNIREQNLKKL